MIRTRIAAARHRITTMDDEDARAIANICRAAAERFDETAKAFHKLIDYVPEPSKPDDMTVDMTPHGEGARLLFGQFKQQAQEARDYAELFAEAYSVEVTTPPDEDEQAA